MKDESSAYTPIDFENFVDEQLNHERNALAGRLEGASAKLAELGPKITAGGGKDEWSAHEVLAHVAGFSKYYGVIVHKVASGQLTQLDLLSGTNMRDTSIEQLSATEPTDLLRMALADHARTAKELRSLDLAALRATANVDGNFWFNPVSAEFLARYPLINHLEEHVEQLERMLG